jgi:hypothetical protein
MNAFIRLAVPVTLGLAAGGLNWWVLYEHVAPQEFVKINEDLQAGHPFEESALEKLELSGDIEALRKAAVPYKERAVLFNRPAGRNLHAGDLVLWGDASPPPPTSLLAEEGEEGLPISLEGISIVPKLLHVGDQVGFLLTAGRAPAAPKSADRGPAPGMELHYVGPFRILSVGDRLGEKAPNETARSSDADDRVITVAIRRGGEGRVLDSDSASLVEAMDAMRGGRDPAGHRVVSILLRPTRAPAPAAKAKAAETGE